MEQVHCAQSLAWKTCQDSASSLIRHKLLGVDDDLFGPVFPDNYFHKERCVYYFTLSVPHDWQFEIDCVSLRCWQFLLKPEAEEKLWGGMLVPFFF